MGGKIKVLVVEDSSFMRQFISNLLNADTDLEVIGTAKNGLEGLEKTKELKPDVITLDVEMPVMDGLTALEKIMQEVPTPVIMLSSLTTDGAEATIRALELGAVDFVPKPSGSISLDLAKVKDDLIAKIKGCARARVGTSQYTIMKPRFQSREEKQQVTPLLHKRPSKLIAIGTSTGGPKALQEIIPLFPKSLPAGVVVVQHMPKGFTKSLADRLDTLSQVTVKEAEDGDELVPGLVLIAPGDRHLTVEDTGGRLLARLTDEPLVSGHRPSVDRLFASVKRLNLPKVAVILTGMGADGAKEIKEIKLAGGKTIAQDEESCVVFGMPKVAIELGGIDKVVPLKQVALEILKLL